MLGRLQAEETQQAINAQLASNNRVLGDTERRQLTRSLAASIAGVIEDRKAPKATPGFLKQLRGMALRHPAAKRPARKPKS